MARDPAAGSPEFSGLTSGSTLSPPKHRHQASVHTTTTSFHSNQGEFTDLGISSFDVVERPLRQFDQLCVSHSMDSGGSWLFGQGLNLKENGRTPLDTSYF